MFVTIINDCKDENARARQETRAAAFFNAPVVFVGVQNDIDAAGNLIDVLDAAGDTEGVVLVNVAPRSGEAKRWGNGTPFCFFRYKNQLVVSSIDGFTLSLVKKLTIVREVSLMDTPTVLDALFKAGHISDDAKEYITRTQFRSFEFVPRVAHALVLGMPVPATSVAIDEIKDIGGVVWWVDNFGNIKTSLLPEDILFRSGGICTTAFGAFKMYDNLKDVPDAETAVVVGSSGMAGKRFVEIVTQGRSASEKLRLSVGSAVAIVV